MDIGLAGAFLGGVMTLLSPCSAMLLPAFFAFAFTHPARLLQRVGVFYLGLVATLVPLGVLAGSFGAWVSQYRDGIVTWLSVLVIVLGLVQLLGVPLPVLGAPSIATQGSRPLSVFLLGTVYGLAGVCAGPLLGAVLTVAALGGNPLYGGLVLAVFAAGMALPLLLLALLWNRVDRLRGWLRPRMLIIGRWQNAWINVIGGALLIVVGVLLLVTGGTGSLSGLLPASTQAGVESWALGVSGTVSDLLIAFLAAVALLVVVVIRRRRSAADHHSGDRDQA